MEETGLPAEAAVELLIDEELLMQEAMRRGITLDGGAQRQLDRQKVRAMLRDAERKLTPQSVSAEEVRADFETHREKLDVPERRRSWHVLVEATGSEARAAAAEILREVRTAEDPRRVFDRYATAQESPLGFTIRAEELPPISRKAGIEKPYKDALFEAESKGVVRNVVETRYGLHVIVLTEVLAAKPATLEAYDAEIRERLSQKRRFENVASIVRTVQAEGVVEVDDDAVDRLLAASSLPTRAE
jgi:hypothetical protein